MKMSGTSHKIHFMDHKNAVKRSEKYSENIHGPLKIPVKGIIMTHEFSIPLNCHEFAHHEKSGYVSWPGHHENPITSQIYKSLIKVMAFSCVFHCISYNLDCFMGH